MLELMADIQVTQSSLAVFAIVGLIGLAAAIGIAFALFSLRGPKRRRSVASEQPAQSPATESVETPTTQQG
jgi:hypothetical protein